MIKLSPSSTLVILDDKFCLFQSNRVKLGVYEYENIACFTSIILLSRYCKEHLKNKNVETLSYLLSTKYKHLENNNVFEIIVNEYKLSIKKTNTEFNCYSVSFNDKEIGYDLSQREAYKRAFTKLVMKLIDNGKRLEDIIEIIKKVGK